MREGIEIPDIRRLPRRGDRWDESRSAGESAARRSEPVPAREIRGGYQVIGLAANPSRHRTDGWRVGQVLIRINESGLTRIEIGFHSEWLAWEGDPETPIPVYRR
ncbi:hypothetical protein [Streptomyces sp. NPDC018045]|uniref:hypothetical protein n=1 Tax=Streptomyces sp. NPDC018045 TaxID=3365037 RepID=UPI0037984515